ncbi:MAG: cytochrome [Acidimicrobiales bacterium]|nr:cytochrome [Acidimicrobiales bacterium]
MASSAVHDDRLRYDPSSYEFHEDPFPVYARMQAEAPLYHDEERGFFALSCFGDVLAGLSDPRLLSSAQGTLLEQIQRPGDPPDMMIFADPPRHDDLRRLVSRAFTPRRIAELEATTRSLCDAWLEPLVEAGGGELVADLAGRLPMALIGALLGAPPDDFSRLKELSDRLLYREDGSVAQPEDAAAAGLELYLYFGALVAERRARPVDDMMSALIEVTISTDGGTRHLEEGEIVAFCLLLAVAGNETTAKMIATGMVVLADFPDQRALLVREPQRWPAAVEELLRFDPPSHYQGRVTTAPVVLHGQELPTGSTVLLVNGAANRDPDVFEQPGQFRVDREFERHLAFGHGIHYCLGASLARLETRVALQTVLASFPEYEIDRGGVERFRSNIRGLSRVPFAG